MPTASLSEREAAAECRGFRLAIDAVRASHAAAYDTATGLNVLDDASTWEVCERYVEAIAEACRLRTGRRPPASKRATCAISR